MLLPRTYVQTAAGAIAGDPVGEMDQGLALFLALPAQAQAAVLTSPAFGQPGARDDYAHFLANQLLGGAVSFNDVPIADLAVSHIKNYAPRASASAVRALIDIAVLQEATSWGIVAPTEFAPSGNAAAPTAANPGDPPPGFTAPQWLALINSNPEVAARLRTEHQQRPSTFAQVATGLMEAANIALTAVQRHQLNSLAAQRLAQSHASAMARLDMERQNTTASLLLAQQAAAPPPAPPVPSAADALASMQAQLAITPPSAPPAPPPPQGMGTGTKVAIVAGLGAAVAGGVWWSRRRR